VTVPSCATVDSSDSSLSRSLSVSQSLDPELQTAASLLNSTSLRTIPEQIQFAVRNRMISASERRICTHDS
jgi:hypothetical protein